MTPENYEKLRQKIIEACPELMELSFGCTIKLAGTGTSVFDGLILGEYEYPIGHIEYKILIKGISAPPFENICIFEKENFTEILGHPIRISHVLRVIEKSKLLMTIEECGWIDGMAKWNLEQDDLALQSDETKQFLFDLLTPKTDE